MIDNLPLSQPASESFAGQPSITEANVPVPPKPKKIKTLVGLLLILFLIVSIPAGVLIVKQRQEIRKEAAVEADNLICREWGAPPPGYKNPGISRPGENINFYRAPGKNAPGEEVISRCDYNVALEKAGGNVNNIKCDSGPGGYALPNGQSYRSLGCDGDSESTACYTRKISDFIDPTYKEGKCQVIQVDLTGCNSNIWAGGIAFVIAYNDECPEITSTPTPTGELTGTPTPTGSTTSTPTPTSSLTSTPTPTGVTTPTPTTVTSCYSQCSADSDCQGGLVCLLKDGVKRCLNKDCESENDCTCNKNCWEICGTDSECPGGLSCVQTGAYKRCLNSACPIEEDCNCTPVTGPTPTPTEIALPEVGFTPPTIGIAAGGLLLIIFSLLLAL